MHSELAKKLSEGQKVFTAEIAPPKGAGTKKLIRHVEAIKPWADAINITDCQRALVRMSSLAACRVLLDQGVEPVYQLTCRDRNSIALQADLMGASALGIRNVLCLTGDPVKVGDSPQSKSVFEVESVGLLSILKKLQAGHDSNEHKMNAPTKFYVGGVVNPSLENGASQLARMEKKIEAGAEFFQTQANYDPEGFYEFLKSTRPLGVKVLAGILVIVDATMARFIHENIPGIRMPTSTIQRLESAADPVKEGIQMAVEMMRVLAPVSDGFHLMTVRQEELIPDIAKAYRESL